MIFEHFYISEQRVIDVMEGWKVNKLTILMTEMDSYFFKSLFRAQSTTRDDIRAEGDFYKEIQSWKDQ